MKIIFCKKRHIVYIFSKCDNTHGYFYVIIGLFVWKIATALAGLLLPFGKKSKLSLQAQQQMLSKPFGGGLSFTLLASNYGEHYWYCGEA